MSRDFAEADVAELKVLEAAEALGFPGMDVPVIVAYPDPEEEAADDLPPRPGSSCWPPPDLPRRAASRKGPFHAAPARPGEAPA